MTTPSVYRLENLLTDGRTISYDKDGKVTGDEIVSNIRTRYRYDSRPASLNNKVVNGWRSPSPWSHDGTSAAPCGGDFRCRSPQFPLSGADYYDGSGWTDKMSTIQDISLPGSLTDRAVIKALLRLKDQKVNLAQAFAERDQTVRLLVDTCSSISNSVRAFRKKSPSRIWTIIKKQGRVRQDVSKEFLAVQYGWKPLLADLHGSAEALRKSASGGDKFRVNVVGKVTQSSTDMWRKPVSDGIHSIGYNVKRKRVDHVKVRLDYTMQNPLLASLSQAGITNPLDIVWELVPWSFVVDWIVPVGDYLQSFDAAYGWLFKGGSLTVFRTLDEKAVNWFTTGELINGNLYTPNGPPTYYNRRFSMSRQVYGTSPLPRFPGIKNPLSRTHIANAIALLASSFR